MGTVIRDNAGNNDLGNIYKAILLIRMARHIFGRGVSDVYKSRWSPATVESAVHWAEDVLQGDCDDASFGDNDV